MNQIAQETIPATLRKRRRNIALMALAPALLAAIGLYAWLTGGRYVSTDNAYIKQDKVSVAPDVPGRIVDVLVEENQHVTAGQPLFRLDQRPLYIALQEAEAALASARISVEQLHAAYQEALADLHNAQDDVAYQEHEFERQSSLAKTGAASQSKLDDVRHALQSARDDAMKNQQTVNSALAALGAQIDAPVERHPLVLEAIARRDKAALDLSHATVTASDAGTISRTGLLQVGMYVVTGAPVVTLVKDMPIWVEANFKETDLTKMRPGQAATIRVDTFPDLRIDATVDSIGAGTGSEFSLLPAQNASGNWVKVVQRIPVRLKLQTVPAGGLLKTGMSVTARVDTRSAAKGETPDENNAPTALRVGELR